MSFLLGSFWDCIGGFHRQQWGEEGSSSTCLGVVGAVIGGWLFNRFGAAGVTGLNLYSLLVAVIGAVVVLLVYHALRRAV